MIIANAMTIPGMECGKNNNPSRMALPWIFVRTTIHETKNASSIVAVAANPIKIKVFQITEKKCGRENTSAKWRKERSESASKEGVRELGSKEDQRRIPKGTNTAKKQKDST